MAILVVFSLFFIKVWLIHFHFQRFIMIASSSCSDLAHSSSFVMTFGQKIPSTWWSLLLTNVCTLESRVLVSLHISLRTLYWHSTTCLNLLEWLLRGNDLSQSRFKSSFPAIRKQAFLTTFIFPLMADLISAHEMLFVFIRSTPPGCKRGRWIMIVNLVPLQSVLSSVRVVYQL